VILPKEHLSYVLLYLLIIDQEQESFVVVVVLYVIPVSGTRKD
jgi:hypothetical protein